MAETAVAALGVDTLSVATHVRDLLALVAVYTHTGREDTHLFSLFKINDQTRKFH